MTITRIKLGDRMSEAVVHNNTVYTAGQVGKGATVAEQTADVLSLIDNLLAQAGTDKSNLLSATIWITDMANFAEMNAVWDNWVSKGNAPARACVESKLALPEFLVEIQVTAAIA